MARAWYSGSDGARGSFHWQMHTIPTLLAAFVPCLLGVGGYRYVASGDPWWLVAAAVAALSLAAVVTRREREL
jgi:1,4-dihydroxy-2-naphthoate octaprenyltransferase